MKTYIITSDSDIADVAAHSPLAALIGAINRANNDFESGNADMFIGVDNTELSAMRDPEDSDAWFIYTGEAIYPERQVAPYPLTRRIRYEAGTGMPQANAPEVWTL